MIKEDILNSNSLASEYNIFSFRLFSHSLLRLSTSIFQTIASRQLEKTATLAPRENKNNNSQQPRHQVKKPSKNGTQQPTRKQQQETAVQVSWKRKKRQFAGRALEKRRGASLWDRASSAEESIGDGAPRERHFPRQGRRGTHLREEWRCRRGPDSSPLCFPHGKASIKARCRPSQGIPTCPLQQETSQQTT